MSKLSSYAFTQKIVYYKVFIGIDIPYLKYLLYIRNVLCLSTDAFFHLQKLGAQLLLCRNTAEYQVSPWLAQST